MQLDRRIFLARTARLLSLAACAVTFPASATPGLRSYPFSLGVASGSPRPTAIVLWTRILLFSFTSTVQAFAVILATFLMGLALGSAFFAWAEGRFDRLRTLAAAQSLAGVLSLLCVPASLRAMDIRVAMLTGDSEDVARWVARELAIDQYFAQVLPEHKADVVREMQSGGRRVAMVGDGINDAPALLTADVGVAIGAGTDVAIESAGIILVRDDPRDVASVVRLSRASYRKMIENLAWATGYNVVAIPLAAGVLYGRGILLPPALAAVLMSVSTVIVAVNARRLRMPG
jgi:soluble P-type ATPase